MNIDKFVGYKVVCCVRGKSHIGVLIKLNNQYQIYSDKTYVLFSSSEVESMFYYAD